MKKQANINEWSYQRYARFMGITELKDEEFQTKIYKIAYLINDIHENNINTIASATNCTFDECILKICYLKNKRIIDDYYIDSAAGIISICSKEDKELLKKYEFLLYNKHASISDISSYLKIDANKVWEELRYLDSKKLLNGVILDEIDNKIIYYSIEKHLKEKDYVTINCPNCGAINDIKRGSKTRCAYCNTIIEDSSISNIIRENIEQKIIEK